MLRDEPTIRPSLYRLPRDPVGEHILVPAFRQATQVRGAFGWFSAGWISRLAHGLAVFLSRPELAPIRFTIAPALFPEEYDILKSSIERTDYIVDRLKNILLEAASPTAEILTRHAVECLAWMVVNDRIDLRIAKVRPGANYHPKIWLFYDELDIVAVRGSANATGRAYSRGIEHMDVDCTWDNRSRVEIAVSMVDEWTEGRDDEIEDVLDLPSALEGVMIRLAPREKPSVNDYENFMRDFGFSKKTTIPNRDDPTLFHIPSTLEWRQGRYAHQGEAVLAWESFGRRGIIAMATGAGKTISALICTYRVWQEHHGPFLVVISAPSTPLLLQWRTECEKFGITAILPTISKSKSEKNTIIGNCLLRLRTGKAGHIEVMIVTNQLITTLEFQNSLRDAKNRIPDLRILHIGDEAHTLGSPSFIRQTPEFCDYRLGLSATPERQYDDEGTQQLFKYFGATVFEFGLEKAIGFCLVPYEYHVHIALLNSTELEEFRNLSARIARFVSKAGGIFDFSDESLTALLVKRRSVVETANSKIDKLNDILRGRTTPLRHTLIYTSSKNPNQLIAAKHVVAELGLIVRQITENETQDRESLERILQAFGEGEYDVLVAKRVLDEGVDIPQTREAILLASSSVEREWVQRRGRVLRPSPGKSSAVLHDIIALPPAKAGIYDDGVLQFISSELDRVRAFGRHAMNKNDVLSFVSGVHRDYFKE